jgi:threonylcarbamoyladenosine tRNA methylthiotransferase MtaB
LNQLKNETIEFVSKVELCPHFHIPLQSGSNDILKLMKRRYQREVYTEKSKQNSGSNATPCIGVDVIVVFLAKQTSIS